MNWLSTSYTLFYLHVWYERELCILCPLHSISLLRNVFFSRIMTRQFHVAHYSLFPYCIDYKYRLKICNFIVKMVHAFDLMGSHARPKAQLIYWLAENVIFTALDRLELAILLWKWCMQLIWWEAESSAHLLALLFSWRICYLYRFGQNTRTLNNVSKNENNTWITENDWIYSHIPIKLVYEWYNTII